MAINMREFQGLNQGLLQGPSAKSMREAPVSSRPSEWDERLKWRPQPNGAD